MDSNSTAREAEVIDKAARFAAEHIKPVAESWERSRAQPAATFREACRVGLGGLLVPEELGGSGLDVTAAAHVFETLAAADMAFAFGLVVHNNLARSVARHGNDAQIERYLAGLMSGDRVGAFLLTEPDAGSDAAAITTHADCTGDGWVLNGEKAWVSNAATADVLSVYVQTDPAKRSRGIACFLIDGDTPGVVRQDPYHLMGGHALGTGGFQFRDCRLGQAALFIPAGDAFKVALVGIDLARCMVGAMCCGMMGEALNLALERARARRAFGYQIAEFQGLQWTLAEVATDLEAARLLTYRATALFDKGADATLAAAHAKKFATRAALRGIADCMQIMGADGYRQDQPFARHMAAAKMAQYLDGTTEIQNVVIARRLLADAGT